MLWFRIIVITDIQPRLQLCISLNCVEISKTFPLGSSVMRIIMHEVLIVLCRCHKAFRHQTKDHLPLSILYRTSVTAIQWEALPTSRGLVAIGTNSFFPASRLSTYAIGLLKPIFLTDLSSSIISLSKPIARCWKRYFLCVCQKLDKTKQKNILLKFRSIEENVIK